MDCHILKKELAAGKVEIGRKDSISESDWRRLAKEMCRQLPGIVGNGRSAESYYNDIISNRDSETRNMLLVKDIDHSTLLKLQELPLFNLGQFRSGIIVRKEQTRQYPYGDLARRVIGDVKIDPEDPEANRFVGIEGQYDYILHGTKGIEWMKRTDKGMIRNVDSSSVAVRHGNDVKTTIDIDIQDIADRALRKQIQDNPEVLGGAIVVMDVETGAVRAMVNLSRSSKDVMGEYFNSAIGRPAEPGSIFKAVSLLTLLEDGHVELETEIPTNHGRMKEYPKMTPDDYIVKPFPLAVLAEKCNVIIGRHKGNKLQKEITCCGITADKSRMSVSVDGEEIALANKTFRLLVLLMENKNNVLSREQILTKIWGWDFEGDERVVDTHIKKLRKALGERSVHVKTVIGGGYSFREE